MEEFEDFMIDEDDEIFFGIPDDEDIDMSGIDYLWEDEEEQLAAFSDVVSGPSTSSSTSKSSSKSKKKSQPSKPPAKKKKSNEPRLPCPHCDKTYANKGTLQTHLNSMVVKDLVRRVPNFDDLLAAMPDLCVEALLEMKDDLSVGEVAKDCASFANRLAIFIRQCDASSLLKFLTDKFLSYCRCDNVTLLSSLRETFVVGTNQLLNSPDYRSDLSDELKIIFEWSERVLNFFVGCFTNRLSNKILIFTSKTMRQSRPNEDRGPYKRSKDDFSSPRFKRIVHYIAGSVVCGVNRRRRTYPKSSRITTFASIINKTFIEDKEDAETWCEESVKKWTAAQNRGGLCFVSNKAFDFFQRVVMTTMSLEEEDGSVYLKKVILGVCDDFNILSLWDELVGDAINEDMSLEWLTSVVNIICRCVSKGIIKRRLNEALEKPISNVPLRPKLAR